MNLVILKLVYRQIRLMLCFHAHQYNAGESCAHNKVFHVFFRMFFRKGNIVSFKKGAIIRLDTLANDRFLDRGGCGMAVPEIHMEVGSGVVIHTIRVC